TVFGDLLKALPRSTFQKMVREVDSDKHHKGFSSWDHLVAMVYGQLAGASSLREIEAGFNHHVPQHYHLGTHAVRRSTLADANRHRTPELFTRVCHHLMHQVGRQQRRELRD